MDDSAGLARAVAFGVAGYPLYLARTLMQLGYEPTRPNSAGQLPNIFYYITIIKEQGGYLSLYTGLRYYLPAVVIKKTIGDLMSSDSNQKSESERRDASKIIADCLYESAVKIYTTILTYPLVTLGVGYISSAFFGNTETIEYTLESSYRGLLPKLIVEVTMVWVSIISRRITMSLVDDETGQAIISRVPPFIVQSFLYPFNVVSTVMADNGKSGMNPKFQDWWQCFHYLREHNQLKRGSSFFWRRAYPSLADGNTFSVKRYM